MVDRLPASCRRHRPATVLLGYGIAPAFFCPLFGGGFWDSLSAFFCGLVVGTCLLFGGRWLGSNSFLRTLVCSGIASLLSLLLVRAGLGNNVDLVTIGVLMLLVPGVALTNAMREIVAGDTYSGLSRTAEAILIATGMLWGPLWAWASGIFCKGDLLLWISGLNMFCPACVLSPAVSDSLWCSISMAPAS